MISGDHTIQYLDIQFIYIYTQCAYIYIHTVNIDYIYIVVIFSTRKQMGEPGIISPTAATGSL
jgi:hypothetical protein